METNVIWRNARAAVIELDDGGYFTCADTWEIFVNDEPAGTTNTVETYVDGLTPGKRNLVRFVCGERELSVGVTTPAEPFTINVRDCGAKGDAEHDDTTNIQAAIMACPKGGRVLIPAGSYRIKSLFLKSNINIELAEGAVLLARHDRAALAYIPGTVTGDTSLNGNVILDVHGLEILDAIALENAINGIPGVVTVGLFANRGADVALIGTADGVKTIVK